MKELPKDYVRILDKGYLGLVGTLGNDDSPADAARVSFAKRASEFPAERNEKLIDYLFAGKEYSCLRHNVFTFEIRMPLMVARQLWKYIVASNFTEDQLGWNENSRRYITDSNEFYLPSKYEWRTAPENKKQGSAEPLNQLEGLIWNDNLERFYNEGERLYQKAIDAGIAPEQARLFLPAYGLYVSAFWTVSLGSIFHILNERLDHSAQFEIQQYAKALAEFVKRELPVTYSTWERHH